MCACERANVCVCVRVCVKRCERRVFQFFCTCRCGPARARGKQKLVEWLRAKFLPSHNRRWKSNFKKDVANRKARPWKHTEDDDPSLEEFRVSLKLGLRKYRGPLNSGYGIPYRRSLEVGKSELIDRAVAFLSQMFSFSGLW